MLGEVNVLFLHVSVPKKSVTEGNAGLPNQNWASAEPSSVRCNDVAGSPGKQTCGK